MNTLFEKITSRGYLQVIIRPTDFVANRVSDIASLYPILEKTYVKLRGWYFPHLDYRNSPRIDINWIGQEYDWEHHLAMWRFYQSGQFFHVSGIWVDWRDQSSVWPADKNWKPGALLGAGDTIFSFTEIFEFGARLALSDAGGEQMHIEIVIGNLKGRVLYADSPRRWSFDFPYKASIEVFPYSIDLPRSDLIARPKDIALEPAIELFKRFGWNTTIEHLRSWQEELGR